MTRYLIFVSALLLHTASLSASESENSPAYLGELKKFWQVQFDEGELGSIKKVKACYFSLQKTNPVIEAALHRCIVWDIALTHLSGAVAKEISDTTGKPIQDIQPPYTRLESMQKRALDSLTKAGMSNVAAYERLSALEVKVASVYERAYLETMQRKK